MFYLQTTNSDYTTSIKTNILNIIKMKEKCFYKKFQVQRIHDHD